MYVVQSSIVNPDRELNREVPLASKQGLFSITVTNETYPMPLNQLDLEITWSGMEIVKRFDACQQLVRFINIYEAVLEIDEEAAEAYYQAWVNDHLDSLNESGLFDSDAEK